jgi:hypothetical protein
MNISLIVSIIVLSSVYVQANCSRSTRWHNSIRTTSLIRGGRKRPSLGYMFKAFWQTLLDPESESRLKIEHDKDLKAPKKLKKEKKQFF